MLLGRIRAFRPRGRVVPSRKCVAMRIQAALQTPHREAEGPLKVRPSAKSTGLPSKAAMLAELAQ